MFITFEGGEGAGKTSLVQRMKEALESAGCAVLVTREPGGCQLGNEVRKLLLVHSESHDLSGMAELLLLLAARHQHLHEVILPAIKKGMVVLCDRFNDSSVAYQGHGRGVGAETVERLYKTSCGDTMPDKTFFLDVDPMIGLERSKRLSKDTASAGNLDRIEKEALTFHQAVREGYLSLAKRQPSRFHIVDANTDLDTIFHDTWPIVQKLVMSKKGSS